MATMRLTKRAVDGLAPSNRELRVYDADLSGLGVGCMPLRREELDCRYRPKGGGRLVPTKRMTLGQTTKLTADEARNAARNVLATVRLGADPAGERRKRRETPTVAHSSNSSWPKRLSPSESRRRPVVFRYYARNFIVPKIGPIKADALTEADVNRLHRKSAGNTRSRPTAS